MPERLELEGLLLGHLAWIDKASATLCRRSGMSPRDAEEFASWARLRLIEDDYSILRKFRNESKFSTYLTVVLTMLFRDFRVHQWGRWRPSAVAQRLGNVAIALETLVYRDGMPLDQAVKVLQVNCRVELTERELRGLFSRLPRRTPVRPTEVGPTPLDSAESNEHADTDVLADEASQHKAAIDIAVTSALACLRPEDQLILRLRFWEGLGIADISRALGLPQKPLYRHVDRVLHDLKTRLQAAGVSAEEARSILAEAEAWRALS
jgi:RNA polymerase sigma factor for flagellar operon FliA